MIKQIKSNNLKHNDKIYEVIMKLYSNKKTSFKAKQTNPIWNINYSKINKYQELLTTFLLTKDYYNDTTKIFKFFDMSMI